MAQMVALIVMMKMMNLHSGRRRAFCACVRVCVSGTVSAPLRKEDKHFIINHC